MEVEGKNNGPNCWGGGMVWMSGVLTVCHIVDCSVVLGLLRSGWTEEGSD